MRAFNEVLHQVFLWCCWLLLTLCVIGIVTAFFGVFAFSLLKGVHLYAVLHAAFIAFASLGDAGIALLVAMVVLIGLAVQLYSLTLRFCLWLRGAFIAPNDKPLIKSLTGEQHV